MMGINEIVKMMARIFMLVSITLFYSCGKSESSEILGEIDFINFGRFYGHCQGEQCREIFRLEGDQLFEDTKDEYPSRETFYQGTFKPLSLDKYNKVKDLPLSFPLQLLEEDRTQFGCPDCADQGGFYLEVKKGSRHEFWIIDQNKNDVPNYLHNYMDILNEKISYLSAE